MDDQIDLIVVIHSPFPKINEVILNLNFDALRDDRLVLTFNHDAEINQFLERRQIPDVFPDNFRVARWRGKPAFVRDGLQVELNSLITRNQERVIIFPSNHGEYLQHCNTSKQCNSSFSNTLIRSTVHESLSTFTDKMQR